MPRTRNTVLALTALLAAAAMVTYMARMLQHQVDSPKPFSMPKAAPAAVQPEVAASPPPSASASAASEPMPSAAPAVASAPPLDSDGIGPALAGLLGDQAVLSWIQATDFPHRFVTTVDNLGRSDAPASQWPVNPTAGRFVVVERDGRSFIDPDNDLRYTALVLLAEQVDAKRAATLYVRMLPLLQAAYEDIGFPRGQFHERLMSVLAQLQGTPDVPRPLEVRLTEVEGPFPSTRPWVRYEFADPSLEQASAGQKILLRIGPVNHRRLKAVLARFRRELSSL